MNKSEAIAQDLLSIKAISLSPKKPYTWASGLKSPIYCDNRLTLGDVKSRKDIAAGLAELIHEKFPQATVIAGTATAGIPHATSVADRLNLPLIYVRSKPKDHGQGKQIEGKTLDTTDQVVVIDDLISTGGSVLKAVSAVQQTGAKVLGVVGIFSYQLQASKENFEAAGLPFYTLTNYSTLIETALKQNRIDEEEHQLLKTWHEDPNHWD